MWYCDTCRNEFDEPERKKECFEDFYEVSNLFYGRNYFDALVCPHCGNDDIEEMRECEKCGEYCRECDLLDTEGLPGGGIGDLCIDCYRDCGFGGE